MCMWNIRFRVWLPIVFGSLAIALIAWDRYNQTVLGSHMEGGFPIWPYRVPSILLYAINFPVTVLAKPFLLLPNMQTFDAQYFVWLPLIFIWWWWIGTRIDFGVLGRRNYRHVKLTSGLLIAVVIVLLGVVSIAIVDIFHSWREYHNTISLIGSGVLIRSAGPVVWCIVLAGCAISAVAKLLQGKFSPPSEKHPRSLRFVGVTAIVVLYIGAVSAFERIPTIDRNSCQTDAQTGCVHGTVVDENGKPIKGIEVEFIPTFKTGDAQWISTKHEWTDEQGRYNLNQVDPGKYLLGVHIEGAPDSVQPFATAYFPGVDEQVAASRISVTASTSTSLNPLQLHRIEVVTIKVKVEWPDGTRPERSNLSFQNISYPHQAVIGDNAPQVDDGIGQFTLPKGFDYDALADVQCDAGKIIESRESRPVQRITVRDGFTPTELTFVIPGPPCKLWQPK
jgi:hypothetical protein